MKSKTAKIVAYLTANPDAKAKEVATKFKVTTPYIYNLRKKVTPVVPKLLPVPEAPKVDAVDAVLDTRQSTYGSFADNALTAQRLKAVLRTQEGWYRLSPVQQESIEMIMHKISRLVNGDPTYIDTVVDISGYNELMLRDMRSRANARTEKVDQ